MNEKAKIAVVIMAGGKGTRMNTDLPKVLVELKGRPLLSYVLETAHSLEPEKIIVVVGHKREQVIERFKGEKITFITQEPQLGTGHAVAQTHGALKDFMGDIVTLSGDVPLIKKETIEKLIEKHRSKNGAVTLLTLNLDEPKSYGRIIRKDDIIIRNVEAKDATASDLKVKEINCGVYVFQSSFLFPALKRIDNDNAQGEYYLTDLINMAVADGLKVAGVKTNNPTEALGVNTLKDLQNLTGRL